MFARILAAAQSTKGYFIMLSSSAMTGVTLLLILGVPARVLRDLLLTCSIERGCRSVAYAAETCHVAGVVLAKASLGEHCSLAAS